MGFQSGGGDLGVGAARFRGSSNLGQRVPNVTSGCHCQPIRNDKVHQRRVLDVVFVQSLAKNLVWGLGFRFIKDVSLMSCLSRASQRIWFGVLGLDSSKTCP